MPPFLAPPTKTLIGYSLEFEVWTSRLLSGPVVHPHQQREDGHLQEGAALGAALGAARSATQDASGQR